jgi:inosose dehydratase
VSTTLTKIKVANAPCSWGALEFELSGKSKTFERVLDEMQQSGYEGTELGDWGFMPTEPSRLKAEVQKRNLKMLAAFVPVDLSNPQAHAEGAERAVRTAELLAAVGDKPFIVLSDDNCKNKTRWAESGRITREHAMSDRQWIDFIQGTHRVAREVLRRTGIRTVFHHHVAGFIETPWEIDRFLSATDPDLIGLCFDTGHYAFGGGDAFDGLRKHASRIQHVHYKDCDPRIKARSQELKWDYFKSVNNGIFCELGKGSVPFASITDELKRTGYSGWIVVEQDVMPGMGTPLESAIRNRAFLKEIGL